MNPTRVTPFGMSRQHLGYRDVGEYRHWLLRSSAPYFAVALAVVAVSVLATTPDWPLFAAGWGVAVLCLAVASVRPDLWLFVPFGSLAAIILVRWGTDGFDAGLGPLLLVPLVAIAVFGSSRALAAMLALILLAVVAIHLATGISRVTVAPAWRQDAILLILATMLGLSIHRLVSRLRTERLAGRTRETQLSRTSRITRAIATSSEPARTLCRKAVELTAARGAALFRDHPDGPRLLAWENGDPGVLGEFAATAAAAALDRARDEPAGDGIAILGEDSPELERSREAWGDPDVTSVVLVATRYRSQVTGLLALAWPSRPMPADAAIPLDLLGAEASISIRNQELTERLERLALTDALTGAVNRRGWDQQMVRAVSSARRYRRPLSLAMLDLDGFKEYNDEFGHPAGDRLLSQYVARWQSLIRGSDQIARLGGDEFVITLPDTTRSQALTVIKRICAMPAGRVRVSAGIAEWDGTEASLDLLKRADQALYEAKEKRPGSVVAAGPGPD